MARLSDEDRRHLEEEAENATDEEKALMIEQVMELLDGEQDDGDHPSEKEWNQRWEDALAMLSPEDEEHLRKEAAGATADEKYELLQEVGGRALRESFLARLAY